MNAETLKENVLAILRGNSLTKDVEALTQFQVHGFNFAESQEELKKAKAYLARETASAQMTPSEPVQAETVLPENTVDLGASAQAVGTPEANQRYVEYCAYLTAIFRPDDVLCFASINHATGITNQVFATLEDALTLDSFQNLIRANADASIYVAMNTYPESLVGQRKGRTQENVVEVRALQADIDDAQQAENIVSAMQSSAKVPPPSIVVESSPGKRQGIWCVDGIAKEDAKPLMQAIAAEFKTDSAVAEVARVMRLPGFVNRKYATEPVAKLLVNTGVRYARDAFHVSTVAEKIDRKPEGWLDEPFVRGSIYNQVLQFVGHFMSTKNIDDGDQMFALIKLKMEKNGCYERGGKIPFAWDQEQVRQQCHKLVNEWETGEEQKQEAISEALAEGAKIGEQALAAKVQPSTLLMSTAVLVEEPETVEVFDPKNAQSWQAMDMTCAVMNGRLGEVCDERMLAYFPIAYAWPALIAAAGAMVPQVSQEGGMIQPSNMVNSYTGLVGPVHSGKSQAIHWATRIAGIPDTNYTDLKAGSSEGLLSKLAALKNKGAIKDSVLIDLDEWAHFFSKAGIENSSFTSFLHTAFYKRKQSIIAGRGRDVEVNCALSFIGGIVEDDFETCFNATSLGGLHDRFTFGLCPEGFNFMYRPFEGRPEVFEPVSVLIAPEIFELTESIRKDSKNSIGREAEIAVRAAQVCASFDGIRILDAKYGERMIRAMIAEQSKVRQYLQPNAGVTIDAQVSNALMSWLVRNVPDGKLALEREVRQGLRKTLSRFGSNALEYATRGLIKQGVIWYGPVPNMKPWKGRQPHAYRLMDASGYSAAIYK